MPAKSKDEPVSEKKPEVKKEPQNVTGTLTTNKKQGKKGTVVCDVLFIHFHNSLPIMQNVDF